MYIPFFSNPREKRLYRRKGGGGGGGHGGGGGGGKGGGGKSGSSSGGGSRGSSVPLSGSSKPGGKSSAMAYGGGGGRVSTIPAGQPFSGRQQGGGKRSDIFGSRTYGSGYPGITGRGVAGRGFPYFFWPVVWGGSAGLGTAAYLHSGEYGDVSNSNRPGGPMEQAAFISGSSNTTFHVTADNTTVVALVSAIRTNCSTLISGSPLGPTTFDPNNASAPHPEQVIQYYRASSVALTLDGYNNSATFSSDEHAPDTPLPADVDTKLMTCLNQTIGAAVPLIAGAEGRWASPSMGLLGMFWVFWCLSSLIV